jgi:hypothetical protein
VWNLRPGTFDAYYDEARDELYVYRGRIYLPDSHHRHQALIKAHHTWLEATEDYPAYNPGRQYTIDVYFMSRPDEGEFFYQKNVLGKTPDRSKSFDLALSDALSVLARRVVEKTPQLTGNVNRVTDRLAASNPQVVTLSTLRSMAATAAGTDALTDKEVDKLSTYYSTFYELLAEVRPELRKVDLDVRRTYRRESMAAQAVVMQAYGELMRLFAEDADRSGLDKAREAWRERLKVLASDVPYDHRGEWSGDFFARENPLWREIGVLQRTRTGAETVSNTRQTRETTGRELRLRLGV